MNTLLKNSKFWLAVIGSIFGGVSYYMTKDNTITMFVLGLFGSGIVIDTAKGFISKSKS